MRRRTLEYLRPAEARAFATAPVFDVPPARCAWCRHEQTRATGMNDEAPKVGDFTVCVDCGGANRWAEGLALERCDVNAVEDEEAREQLRRLQRTIAAFIATRKGAPA